MIDRTNLICFAQVANKCSLDCILLKLWHINEICKTAHAVQWENIHPPKLEHKKKFELILTSDSLFVDLPDMKMIYCCHATYVLWMYDAWYGLDFLRVFPGTIIKTFTNTKTFCTVWPICPLGLKNWKIYIQHKFASYSWTSSVFIVAPLPTNDNTWIPYQIGRVSRKWEDRQNIQSKRIIYLCLSAIAKDANNLGRRKVN